MERNVKEAKPAPAGGQGYRMTAIGVLQERIRRLRQEADGLEALSRYLDADDELPPEIDEILWSILTAYRRPL